MRRLNARVITDRVAKSSTPSVTSHGESTREREGGRERERVGKREEAISALPPRTRAPSSGYNRRRRAQCRGHYLLAGLSLSPSAPLATSTYSYPYKAAAATCVNRFFTRLQRRRYYHYRVRLAATASLRVHTWIE